jgi:alcohol dehydrogenase (cytochrome c)
VTRINPKFRSLVLGLTAATLMPAMAFAQGTTISYTEAQADRGEDAYAEHCELCHGSTLSGSAETPPLVGAGFRTRFATGSPVALFSYASTAMPQQAPGSLTPETYADITAFLFSKNRIPAGDAELPSDMNVLSAATLPAQVTP